MTDEIEQKTNQTKKKKNAKMADDPKKVHGESGEAIMATEKQGEPAEKPELGLLRPMADPTEAGFVKVALMVTPQGQQTINIDASEKMTFGLAVEMLESAVHRLKNAPVN